MPNMSIENDTFSRKTGHVSPWQPITPSLLGWLSFPTIWFETPVLTFNNVLVTFSQRPGNEGYPGPADRLLALTAASSCQTGRADWDRQAVTMGKLKRAGQTFHRSFTHSLKASHHPRTTPRRTLKAENFYPLPAGWAIIGRASDNRGVYGGCWWKFQVFSLFASQRSFPISPNIH